MTDPVISYRETDWDQRYASGEVPWDSGVPSSLLVGLVREFAIEPCSVLEPGCGTGTNAVWLASHGFDVIGFDPSRVAIERAVERAREADLRIQFENADHATFEPRPEPAALVFDRGVYHGVRREDLEGYLGLLERSTRPGSLFLLLAGNANESPADKGPPTVRASEIVADLEPLFEIVLLRECRFDEILIEDEAHRPLAWSVVARRR